MPTPPRPKLTRPTTFSLSPQLRSDLQKLADKKLAPVAQVIREACLAFVEQEKARAK